MPEIAEKIVSEITLGLKGLTLNEAGHVLHRVFASGQSDEASILEEIFNEKKMLVKKTGDLEFVPPQLGLDAIGGMENIKEWVLNREGVFSQESVESGLPIPKGILVMGISGCGKSLLCKAVASLWKMPLFRLDMNLVFSGLHGSPESSFHNALRTIESVAPAVLWIDEIENGLGMNKEGEFDQSHIFSSFLTWMQEKPPLIFVAATANHIESLPAEIIRKGRFDQVFFCDLPYEQEREAIFKIHLEKNGGKVEDFDMERLVVGTEGWNGAEIEQAVISARIDASREDRDFNTRDIHRHLRSMVPLSETMSEQIKGIRNWAWGRATTASKKPQKKKT